MVILLAEGDPVVRAMLEKLLKQGGYDLLVAQDGQDAIQKSADQKGRIDLLVSNVQMPGMTGVDLARAMRQSRPDLRVILTASFEQGLLVLDTGWQFIQKPYLIKVLLDKIVELIKKPQAPQVDRST
ncbi:MAG: response regulator [Acidobacteriia bacterium]|nr:response regulator [Terriglobia bacterium]